MELWIRSQNKRKLIPIKEELYIPYSRTGEDFGIFYKDNILAHFKTEKRVLEVLDEIQSILNPRGIIKFKSLLSKEDIKRIQDRFDGEFFVGDASSEIIKLGDTYVYEMPKE